MVYSGRGDEDGELPKGQPHHIRDKIPRCMDNEVSVQDVARQRGSKITRIAEAGMRSEGS